MEKKDSVVGVDVPGFGSPGWLMFDWEHGGESGLCGVCLADGDAEGFDEPSDEDARDALLSWIEEFRDRLLERSPWPSRKDACDLWEEMREEGLRAASRPAGGISVRPRGRVDSCNRRREMENNSHVSSVVLRVVSHELVEDGKVRWQAVFGPWSVALTSDRCNCPALGARVKVEASWNTPVRGTEFYEAPIDDEER